jgi:hypothetical protein
MTLGEWIKKGLASDAKHYAVTALPAARIFPEAKHATIVAEEHYFRVWLSEMYLAKDRFIFSKYLPVVHSSVRLTYGGQARELPYVAQPAALGLGASTGDGIQLDHALCNLLPFRGGTVDITAALVAYKSGDYLDGLMGTLNSLGGLLKFGQLSVTLKVIGNALETIHSLPGNAKSKIHLLAYRGFGGQSADNGASLSSGYFAVFRADAEAIPTSKLLVREHRLYVGPTEQRARPFRAFDYMLFRIEAATHRDDYQSFDELSKPLAEAIKLGRRDRKKGDEALARLAEIVWDIGDLTNADRIRAAQAMTLTYEEAVANSNVATAASFTTATTTNPMDAVARAMRRMPKTGPRSPRRLLGRPLEEMDFQSFKALGFSGLKQTSA